MKTSFSRVVALSLLVSVSVPILAQPPEPVAPTEPVAPKGTKTLDIERSKLNSDALALISSFYNKVRRAKTYRGLVIFDTTDTKNGEVTYRFTAEMKSSMICDGKKEGNLSKSFTKYSTKTFQDNETTLETLSSLCDGTKNYRVNEIEKSWSVKAQAANSQAKPVIWALVPWSLVLSLFEAGTNFETHVKTVDGHEQISVVDKGIHIVEFNFDAETGNLLNWIETSTVNDSIRKTEYRWIDTEFDVPLSDESFKWKAPENATQVAPEEMASKMINF